MWGVLVGEKCSYWRKELLSDPKCVIPLWLCSGNAGIKYLFLSFKKPVFSK